MICSWLSERIDRSLHSVQLSALSQIVRVRPSFVAHATRANLAIPLQFFISFAEQKMYSDFTLQGYEEAKLNSKSYQTVINRIQLEEAAASVSETTRDYEDWK